MQMTRRVILTGALASLLPAVLRAADKFEPGPTQYIAALGATTATSGNDAETWGFWEVDPGPRGVYLRDYPALAANANVAPDGWTLDPAGWWVEEYGRLMEAPVFPMPPGRYVVTGGREVTSVLTVQPVDADGHQAWALSHGATIYDVTHLRCRAALYTPLDGQTCTPDAASDDSFPVRVGDAMPAVSGCAKRDYQVLIVVGRMVDV